MSPDPGMADDGSGLREALAALGSGAGRALPCPFCRAALETGTAEVHGTLLGWLAAGYSRQHLFFRPDDGPEERVLERNTPTPALRCPSCRAVLLRPT